MEYRYVPEGVCSTELIFKIEGNIIKKLEIVGGCPGNTVGVARLVQNSLKIHAYEEVIFRFIKCRCCVCSLGRCAQWQPRCVCSLQHVC